MQFSHPILWFFASALALKVLVELVLSLLNRKAALQERAGPVPEAFKHIISQERYIQSLDYTLAKNSFRIGSLLYEGVWTAVVLFSGLLPWLSQAIAAGLGLRALAGWGSFFGYGLAVVLVGFLLGLVELPWEWWAQFRLEARFGFNKSTLGLWISDKIKGFVLSLVVGAPVFALLFKIFQSFPQTWWIGALVLITGLQLLMQIIYPLWIMPWFNRFEPLKEGLLRDRLLALAARTDFTAQDIQVMDGSKRSGHSNAFFAGLGRWRRIVLFDTLVEQFSDEELEAVLAHEIGHYKCGHTMKCLTVSVLVLGLSLAFMGWLLRPEHQHFFELFGFPPNGVMIYDAFLLLSILFGIIGFWFTPFFNLQSRKHEYEADAFAKNAVGSPEPLIRALQGLHEKNLSQLRPHPWFSRFYFGHPTLLERQLALEKGAEKA